MRLRAMDALAKAYWCYRMYKNISWIKLTLGSYYFSKLRHHFSLDRMLYILELHHKSIPSELSELPVLWAVNLLIPDYSARTAKVIIEDPIIKGLLFLKTFWSSIAQIMV
jgi:hypothetical protein